MSNFGSNSGGIDIVKCFQQSGQTSLLTSEISRFVGRNVKDVNVHLYRLQKHGVIQKCREVPPTWELVNRPNNGKCTTGGGTYTSIPSKSRNSSFGAKRNHKEHIQSHRNATDGMQGSILAILKQAGRPLNPNDIARKLGFQKPSEVNPSLYRLQRQGLAEKVRDIPPSWAVTQQTEEEMHGMHPYPSSNNQSQRSRSYQSLTGPYSRNMHDSGQMTTDLSFHSAQQNFIDPAIVSIGSGIKSFHGGVVLSDASQNENATLYQEMDITGDENMDTSSAPTTNNNNNNNALMDADSVTSGGDPVNSSADVSDSFMAADQQKALMSALVKPCSSSSRTDQVQQHRDSSVSTSGGASQQSSEELTEGQIDLLQTLSGFPGGTCSLSELSQASRMGRMTSLVLNLLRKDGYVEIVNQNLKLWTITSSGRAVLEKSSFTRSTENNTNFHSPFSSGQIQHSSATVPSGDEKVQTSLASQRPAKFKPSLPPQQVISGNPNSASSHSSFSSEQILTSSVTVPPGDQKVQTYRASQEPGKFKPPPSPLHLISGNPEFYKPEGVSWQKNSTVQSRSVAKISPTNSFMVSPSNSMRGTTYQIVRPTVPVSTRFNPPASGSGINTNFSSLQSGSKSHTNTSTVVRFTGGATQQLKSEPQCYAPSVMAGGMGSSAASNTGVMAGGMGSAAGDDVLENLNSNSFAALNKNPVSALMEYAQSHKSTATIEVLDSYGPSHNPKFRLAAFIGKRQFPVVIAKNKKDGKKEAADVALRILISEGSYNVSSNNNNMANQIQQLGSKATLFDHVAALAHQAFNRLAGTVTESMAGRKVLAALIMRRGPDDRGSVISLGTGNRCITGPCMSLEGSTVNDSHAEIVTRRGFLRFLYQNLINSSPGSEKSLFQQVSNGRCSLKDGITFHLYISTAPCGDGALFSPRDASTEPCYQDDTQNEHNPTFTNKLQGVLRTKIEGGEGTIPIEPDFTTQTWDGILRGERLRTMSCSDKLCRWNIVGMQGALLSLFIEPIYLSSLTLGLLFDHGHLSRAMCCRLSHGDPEVTSMLSAGYRINHPKLGRVTIYDPPRETEKTKAVSINWSHGDSGAEVMDGTKGQLIERSGTYHVSRISKAALFEQFKQLCKKYKMEGLYSNATYGQVKKSAAAFLDAKNAMITKFKKSGYGPWVEKPVEEGMFS